jgi:hypothetical protein
MNDPAPVAPRRISYLSWRTTTAINRIFLVVAIIALVCDFGIWSLSFASPHVVMPDWIFAPFFAFTFVAFFAAILAVQSAHGWTRRRMPVNFNRLKLIPGVAKVVLIVLGIVAILSGPVALFTGAPGQPGYNAATHQYYFDDHGSITLTTKARYLATSAVQTRAFICFAMLFTIFAILIMDSERRFRRSVVIAPVSSGAVSSPAPRFVMRVWPTVTAALLGVAVMSVGVYGVITRVDSYLGSVQVVTVEGTTQVLSSGPQVVFVWCESEKIDATYSCPSLSPDDIVIEATSTGTTIATSPDPSADHVSPRDLPAVGQLVFDAPQSGAYDLRLTRPISNGVFVARSPGTTFRSAIPVGVLAVFGGVVLVFSLVLLTRRVRWKFAGAPPVDVPED